MTGVLHVDHDQVEHMYCWNVGETGCGSVISGDYQRIGELIKFATHANRLPQAPTRHSPAMRLLYAIGFWTYEARFRAWGLGLRV